jgi:hypothetical protein
METAISVALIGFSGAIIAAIIIASATLFSKKKQDIDAEKMLLVSKVFKNRADYPMQSIIENAKNSVFVIGITLEAVVNVRGILKEKVEQGLAVRLLLLNPHNESLEYFSKFCNVAVGVRKDKIISNLSILEKEFHEELLHKHNFEIRLFDNFFTTGMIGIDIDRKYGQLIVQNYMYHYTPDKNPMFSLFSEDGELYKLYKDNMNFYGVMHNQLFFPKNSLFFPYLHN